MDPNLRLIKLVDPSKSVPKIKNRFAKLTLTSNKKTKNPPEPEETPTDVRTSSKSHPSRKLFDDFLTDDESDSEAEALNKIFRSRRTTKTSDNGAEALQPNTSERRSKSFSQRLQMSDSDETNCSYAEAQKLPDEMGKLEVSASQQDEQKSSKLLTSGTPTDENDVPLRQIESRLSSLDIKGKTEVVTTSSESRKANDAKLENVLKSHWAVKIESHDPNQSNRRVSIMTISSAPTSPISVDDEDDDSDVVIISETEEEEDNDDSYAVSSMRKTDQPPLISDTMQHRLDAFFENIPSLASDEGPERIFAAEKSSDRSNENSIRNIGSVPDESIEICGSSEQSRDEINQTKCSDDENMEKSIDQPQTPSKMPLRSTTPRASPRKSNIPDFIQKQVTPKKPTTPINVAKTLLAVQSEKQLRRSPRKLTPSKATAPTSPRKPRTPRQTPKVRKKPEPPQESPPRPQPATEGQASHKVQSESNTPRVESNDHESDEDSNASPEYRVERINISAKIKIRLQFNDEILLSMQSTPATRNLPRLTESEDTAPSPPTRDIEVEVGTPENLKQRSMRDQNMLTFIDVSKNSVPSQSTTLQDCNLVNQKTRSLQLSEQNDVSLQQESSVAPSTLPPLAVESESSPQKDEPPLMDQIESTPARVMSPLHQSSSSDPGIEINDTAQKLLDQLYGDEWKTPAVVKSMKKKDITRLDVTRPTTNDESVFNFTKFHKNIDLESTRLPELPESVTKTPRHIFKVPTTERKVLTKRKEVVKKAESERKPSRKVKVLTSVQRIKTICDSDTSNSDFNASSDESWRDVFSYSSDSDEDDKMPTKSKKNVKNARSKQHSKDDIIYLDLSSDQVKVQDATDSPCANNDEVFQQRLQALLDTYKCPDKKKIEATPTNNKTKRKLFTPRFGEEDEASPVLPIISRFQPVKDDEDVVKLKAPLPAMFEPINKHLESVKIGKPIFAITPPPKTPVNKRDKVNQAIGEFETPRTVRTPKTASRKVEIPGKILHCTPSDKYGFLQSLDVTVAKAFCHPDALVYRENYKSTKQELAEKLYKIYNANVFHGELDVALTWNKKLLNTAGRCSCSTKTGKRLCRIELSDKVLTSADRLRCTLIHELCHAATWIYNGEHGHGATWKKWARRANAIFPELPKINVCHEYDIDYKYTYKCTLCNAKSHAHSKSKKVENIRCAYCHGAIEVFLNKKDKDGNVMPTPVREPTGFAKFVKENYKKHKRQDLKHADVMKLLSNEFASLNVDGKK